jgi:hypothetical protein
MCLLVVGLLLKHVTASEGKNAPQNIAVHTFIFLRDSTLSTCQYVSCDCLETT